MMGKSTGRICRALWRSLRVRQVSRCISKCLTTNSSNAISMSLSYSIRAVPPPRRAVLFSTDLHLAATTLYRYYRARFHIEFLFRDAKQFTGLTAGQARSEAKLHFHFNASLSAVTFAKLQAQQANPGRLEQPFSMASLQRRAFNQHLLDHIIANLEAGVELTKFSPAYESLCNYGTIVEQAA